MSSQQRLDLDGPLRAACAWCGRPCRVRYCSTRCRVAGHRAKNATPRPPGDVTQVTKRSAGGVTQGDLVDVTPIAPARVTAALYVLADGPYSRVPGVEVWHRGRRAENYWGTAPVVAHPPCGPWGVFRHSVGLRQRADLAVRAVAQVRHSGGVLEHPAGSRLWEACELPNPGGMADRYGGRTYHLSQHWFGHRALKPTWIYVVRCDEAQLPDVRERRRCPPPSTVSKMERRQREQTPMPFARWLVALARTTKGK